MNAAEKRIEEIREKNAATKRRIERAREKNAFLGNSVTRHELSHNRLFKFLEQQGKEAREKNIKEADKINKVTPKRSFSPSRRNPLYDVTRGQMKKKRYAI